ncbi:hypothetical protein [Paenibacillus sp. SYP-B3998]|nr:hypothetical protein [Paenibacillus sp. SYP-B3998]
MSPLVQIAMVSVGLLINLSWFDKHLSFTEPFYYFVLASASVQIYYFIVIAGKWLIRFLSGESELDKKKPKTRIIFMLGLLVCFLLLPNVVSALLYQLWGVLFSDTNLGVGDSIYFAFAINYSLPLYGVFADFQVAVNEHAVLRYVQGNQVVISKIIEFVIIGFLVTRLTGSIQQTLNKKKGAKYSKRK